MSKYQISRLEVRDNPENGSEPLVESVDVEVFDGEPEETLARVEELHLETSYEHVATPIGRKATGDLPPVEEA